MDAIEARIEQAITLLERNIAVHEAACAAYRDVVAAIDGASETVVRVAQTLADLDGHRGALTEAAEALAGITITAEEALALRHRGYQRGWADRGAVLEGEHPRLRLAAGG